VVAQKSANALVRTILEVDHALVEARVLGRCSMAQFCEVVLHYLGLYRR